MHSNAFLGVDSKARACMYLCAEACLRIAHDHSKSFVIAYHFFEEYVNSTFGRLLGLCFTFYLTCPNILKSCKSLVLAFTNTCLRSCICNLQ